MALYAFQCPLGHGFDRIAPMGTEATVCGQCGGNAKRVFAASFSEGRRWASDFVVSASLRQAMDEASGYKAEALTAKHEAEANGFRA